jgi:hypothetical protein
VAIPHRLVVATFAALMLAAWTVPVCCLSMSTPPLGAMQMSGHQHHHHGTFGPAPASKRLTANDACPQTCQPAGVIVTASLDARDGLSVCRSATAALAASIHTITPSPQPFPVGQAASPGIPLAFSHRALPLRI